MNYSKSVPDWQQYNALQSGGSDGAAASMAVAPVAQTLNPNHTFVPSSSPSSMASMNPDCLNKSQSYSAAQNNMSQSPLTPMIHMSNCMGHYTNSSTMNPMMEDMNSSMEHHNNTMPMNGTGNHMVGPNMNINNNLPARIPQTNPASRQNPYMPEPCKGPCCVQDPNSGYAYGSYGSYRENVQMPNYNPEDRRYRTNCRKNSCQSKPQSVPNNQYQIDQRRNYPDYKYRKDGTMPRNYQQPSVILPNFAMQNFNVSGDYMKYHHYPRAGPLPNSANPSVGMIKFQEPPKHMQYQNSGMMQSMMPNNSTVPTQAMQNPYYSQPQKGPNEYANENRETMDQSSQRLQISSGPYAKQQMYRQKFAIQRYTLENQLQEMSRVPGYISNPKYQECVLRYRELLKLQRTVEFQSSIQESSMNANPISPINLQFDHNGMLINSSFLQGNFSGHNQTMNPNSVPVDKTLDNSDPLIGQRKSPAVSQDVRPGSGQLRIPQGTKKDFADKPDLDVRQFLANWDESEEEENAITNVLQKNTTPVAVVQFADLNLVTNLAEASKELGILNGNHIQSNGTVDINKLVSVVGCISSDGNQVPTIHIVDNLENNIVVEKVDGAVSKELENKEASPSLEKTNENPSQVKSTKSTTKNNAEVSDDLSLPELTTYECNPVSTSLNTPTHSDNEESLEQVAQLRMSANPIEIVQNSPIISFTQTSNEKSKCKSDSLNFDLANSGEDKANSSENKKDKANSESKEKSESALLEDRVDRLESLSQKWFSKTAEQYDKNSKNETSSPLSLPTITADDSELILKHQKSKNESNKKHRKIIDDFSICDKIIQELCKESTRESNSDKNCLQKLSKNKLPIAILNALDLNDETIDEEDDIWMEIANISNSIKNNLNTEIEKISKEKQKTLSKLKKVLQSSKLSSNLINLQKIKSLLKADRKNLDVYKQSSKLNTDLCLEDSSSSSNFEKYETIIRKRRGSKDEEKYNDRYDDNLNRYEISRNIRYRSKSVEPNINDEDQLHLLRELKKLKRKRSIGSAAEKVELEKITFNAKEIHSKNEEKSSHRSSSIVCSSPVNLKKNEEESEKLVKNDSNKEIEIQLANVNLRINDKDLRNDFLKEDNKMAKDAVDGIKIEINLSRSDNKKTKIAKVLENKDVRSSEKDDENLSTAADEEETLKQSDTNGQNKNSQKLPQSKNDSECIRNEFLPINFSECLTPVIKENQNNKSSKEHPVVRKPVPKIIDIQELEDQLKLTSQSLNFDPNDDFYSSKKVYDFPKEKHVYNNSKTMSSIDIDNILALNIEDTDPCSSKNRYPDKIVNFIPDSVAFGANSLTFKNYTNEDTFQDETEEKKKSGPSGFFNPAFMEDNDKLNTVPIYTTKDGKIKYSPNRKYTYKMLLMEKQNFGDTSSIYSHRYHVKSKEKKKQKSKRLDDKLHKSSKDNKLGNHKHEHSSEKTCLQKNETEQHRDCSVIAIAPSNPQVEVNPIIEQTNFEKEPTKDQSKKDYVNEKNYLNEDNLLNEESYINEENHFNKEKKISIHKSLPEIKSNNQNVINCKEDNQSKITENRSSVIKQLGVISQDHKESSIIPPVDPQESVKNNLSIEMDQVIKSNSPKTSRNDSETVLMFSKSLPTSNRKSIIQKDAPSDISQRRVVFLKEKSDSKPTRRHSTSTIECQHENKKPRRNSFENDIFINSGLYDDDYDFRGREANEINTVLENKNCFEDEINKERSIEIADNSVTEIICSTIQENESALSNNENLLEKDGENIAYNFIHNKSSENLQMIVDQKIFVTQEESYLEYENDIIENEFVEKDLIFDLQTNDTVPTIDKEDELPSLEKPEVMCNFNNNPSDSESIECPKLEIQVDEPHKINVITTIKDTTNSFQNNIAEEQKAESSIVLSNFPVEDLSENENSKDKFVPKLVIRKTESTSKIVNHSKSPVRDPEERNTRNKTRSRLPKIPKMIIRNASSRPESPTIEEISNFSKSRSSKDKRSVILDSDTKVPKMKINLENELPKVVVEHAKQKTVPKMRIKKIRTLTSVTDEKTLDQSSCRSKSLEDRGYESESKKSDKIPKLKIRKEAEKAKESKKRSSSSSSQSSSSKRLRRDREERSNFSEYECNTKSVPIEKVPKVIIKRTSTRSEFKCELSRSKRRAMEWQPRVTLNSSWILDTMAKEFRHMKLALRLTTPRTIDHFYSQSNVDPNKLKWDKFLSDLKRQNAMSNSEVISFDITTSTSRKCKNVLSITREYSDSENSEFNLTSRIFDENMNSRDKDDSIESSPKKITRRFKLANEKSTYVNENACFKNISPRKSDDEREDSTFLCPVINAEENDDSCTKMSALLINEKLQFDIPERTVTEDCQSGFSRFEGHKKSKNVIKVESSDESQTTIEILPASPDMGQEESELTNEKNARTHSNNAPPLGFSITNIEPVKPKKLNSYEENIDDNAVDSTIEKQKKISSLRHSPTKSHYSQRRQNHSEPSSYQTNVSKRQRQLSKVEKDRLSYSDLLAKEMLAAKETLKRCFHKCCSESDSMCNIKPKITEDKTRFSFKSSNVSRLSSHKNANVSEDTKINPEQSKEERSTRRRSKSYSSLHNKSPLRSRSETETKMVSLNQKKKFETLDSNKVAKKLASAESTNQKFVNSIQKAIQVVREKRESDKRAAKFEDSDKNISQEDGMPVLEPQVNVNLDSNPGRDMSRSPPTITTQDTGDATSPQEEELLKLDFYENDATSVKSKLESDMTIAEIVRELAFHEKASIKHKRYCTLCERWFSSVVRHERHLRGYQHRHTELMQRRTIHTLFTLFTGKPCPKLVPSNITRSDCSLGEPTPLQIVVQDIVLDCNDECSEKQEEDKSDS